MNMFRLSLRYMRRQRKRTVLTAVGIILSVALVSGSGILLTSFLDMKLTQAEKSEGTWHYCVETKTDADRASMLRNNVLVRNAGLCADDTFLQLRGTKERGQSKPSGFSYLQLREYDSAALSMMPYTLTKGRMPRDNGEIALEAGAVPLFGNGVKLGDRVVLPFGKLSAEHGGSGETAERDGADAAAQTFTQTGTKTFTVVGFYNNGIYKWQNGNNAVTLHPEGTHEYKVYVQMKPEVNFPSSIKKAVKDCGLGSDENIHENGIVEWLGKSASTKVRTAVISTFLILAAIILGVMALVIRNSFAMSISERSSQIGLFRCLGASPQQIRGLVLSEALCIWAVAMPVGLLCGIGAMACVIDAVRHIDPEELSYLRLAASAWPFAAAAVLSFAAVLFSARSPVRVAMKVPMIEAVRGNAVYRDGQARKNKKGRFLEKAFGFSGMLAAKNIRRNPKQFHTTLISIVVSVVLFLSIGGFSVAVGNSIETGAHSYGDVDYLFSAQNGAEESEKKLNSFETQIKNLPTVADCQKTPVCIVQVKVPASRVPEKYLSVTRDFRGTDLKGLFADDGKGEKTMPCPMAVVEVSRENYGSLKFSGKAPSYDELLAGKGALLCQTRTFVTGGGRIASADFSDYRAGETLSVFLDSQNGTGGKNWKIQVDGLLSEAPWYLGASSGADGCLVTAQGNVAGLGISKPVSQSSGRNDSGNLTNLAVRYRKGAEQDADARMTKLAEGAESAGVSAFSNYQSNRSEKNSFLIVEIFLVGFTVVIVLISCINIFNTVHANLQTRKRETAMTRAIGMDRKQLYRMLLLECALYGLIGTFWGAVIGLPVQYLLLHTFGHVIMADMRSPLLLVLISFAASVGIGILAGYSSIRKTAHASIVDEIRAQE